MSESCDAPKDAGGIAGGWATVDLPELGAQMYWGLDGVGALLFSQVNLQKYCPYYIARTFHVITAGSVQIGAVLSCGRIHQSVFFLSLSLCFFGCCITRRNLWHGRKSMPPPPPTETAQKEEAWCATWRSEGRTAGRIEETC